METLRLFEKYVRRWLDFCVGDLLYSFLEVGKSRDWIIGKGHFGGVVFYLMNDGVEGVFAIFFRYLMLVRAGVSHVLMIMFWIA